jgi:ligand-binding sensor domain-containing protein/signal transduction histidine kinase
MPGLVLVWATLLFVLGGGTQVSALDGRRALAQYVHTVWGADKGYIGGAVYVIAQSADGYLWLGTERGLVRFDGSEFILIRTPLQGQKTIGAVRGLIEDSEGNLWIRLDGPRLLRYRDGVFEDAVSKFALSDVLITAISKDNTGNLLLWSFQKGLLRFQGQQFEQVLPRDRIEGVVYSLAESSGGVLWLGSRDSGLYRIERGESSEVVSEEMLGSVNALAPSEHGGVWIGSGNGLHLWENGVLTPLKLAAELNNAEVFTLVRDHDHNLWAGTDVGLYRIDPERRTVTGFYRNPDDARISSIYEDGQGDLWFAGVRGIECLRDGMFTSFSPQQTGLDKIAGPLFADDFGRVWFAPALGGLFCLVDGSVKRIPVPDLGNDVIYSIDGSKDELWLGRQRGGLTELTRRGDQWLARTFTQKDGLAQNSVYSVTRARDGTLWAGTVSGGISVLRHGRFETYTANNGLQSNAIFSSLEAADKTMWFATSSGLVSFDGAHWVTYHGADTGPILNVRTVFEDSSHVLWIGTSHGLARFRGNQIEVLQDLPQPLSEEILSIGEDAQGFLWVVTDQHVLQIDQKKLVSGTLESEDVLSYGASDGLAETEGIRRHRSLVSDSSGRIWLSSLHSLAVADVGKAKAYLQTVHVRIDSVSTDGASTQSGQGLTLPPSTRSITFRYGGTNMAMPERARFRYRLDSLDHTWSAGASSRQVVFTALSPGSYTFRIMASNALGFWNGPENDVTFAVRPAFWQTWYFRALCAVLVGALSIALYRIRLMQVTGKLNRRFQDRLADRARIAQDLHDTLLQGVISASMQLDVAQDDLPEDSPARPRLQRLLLQMRQFTDEGRKALQGLRTIDNSVTVEAAFQGMTNELATSQSSGHLVHVEGDTHPLKTAVFDEVYRIGREAYLNAVAHASAREIEIIVEYGFHAFRLRVRDDGCGINPGILNHGREGHWGLAGMRERAKAIGSDLAIHSRPSGGTDVELRVPAAIAYERGASSRIQWPWPPWRFYSKRKKEHEQS